MASSIHQSEHVLRPLSELRLWDKNPRRGTKDQMDRLKRKIEKHGLYKALITTKDGEILGGNMRFRILKDLGVEKVWCSIAEPKNEAEKIEIAISDNESDGEWVEEELAELIHNQPIELDLLSVHLAQPIPLRNLLEGEEAEIEEDEPPDVDAGGGAVSIVGKIYQLGSHRLMCGDSTTDLPLLMDGAQADMLLTDPPYGIDYEGGTKKRDKIDNDARPVYDFYVEFLQAARAQCKSSAAAYIWHASTETHNAIQAFIDAGWQFKQYLIWVKNNATFGRQDYHWRHEPCIYGWGEGSHKWYGDRKQDTVWEFDRPARSEEHPTMKPVGLCARSITNSTQPDDIVLDTFGGSGSTLIAADQLDRTCYTMELDPKYCDVIRKRYAKLKGVENSWEKATPAIDSESTNS